MALLSCCPLSAVCFVCPPCPPCAHRLPSAPSSAAQRRPAGVSNRALGVSPGPIPKDWIARRAGELLFSAAVPPFRGFRLGNRFGRSARLLSLPGRNPTAANCSHFSVPSPRRPESPRAVLLQRRGEETGSSTAPSNHEPPATSGSITAGLVARRIFPPPRHLAVGASGGSPLEGWLMTRRRPAAIGAGPADEYTFSCPFRPFVRLPRPRGWLAVPPLSGSCSSGSIFLSSRI